MAKEIDFENIIIDKKNGLTINGATGEIMEDKFLVLDIIKKKERQEQIDRATKKEMKRNAGIVNKNETRRSDWKVDSHFIKLYRTEMRDYREIVQISANAGLLLSYIMQYIEYETNRVAKKNGSNFSNKELFESLGISDKTLKNSLNELEEKHFIKRVGNRQAREIYFNPYFMCSGNDLNYETINLFNDYIPST